MPVTLVPSDSSSRLGTPSRSISSEAHNSSLALAIAASIVLFAAAYANSWRNSFQFDDAHVVATNPAIRSLTGIPRFFTDARTFSSLPANQTYRPIVTLTLAIDHATATATTGDGLDPRAYHLTQLALLALVAVLAGAIALHVFGEASRDNPGKAALREEQIPRCARDDNLEAWAPAAAVVAAALFALHVGNTQVGNYISARSESLSAVGALFGLLLYLRSGVARRTHLYLLPMALGALAKTPAVLLAPLILAWSAIVSDHVDRRARVQNAVARAIPSFVTAIALFVFVEGMNPREQTYGGAGWAQNLWTQAWVAVRYAGMFFFPTGLSADTDWTPLPSPFDPRVAAGVALLLCSIWVVWRTAQVPITRPIAFGVAWFWIGLVPSAAVPLAEVTNDHRPFLAFVGMTIAVVWSSVLLIRRATAATHSTRVAVFLAGSVLVAHAVGTHVRNRVWRNEATLWADVARTSPGNARGLMNFALTTLRDGRFLEARALLDSAARLAPRYPLIHVNMALAANAEGDTSAALASFRRAIAIDARNADAHRYYARWAAVHGRAREALIEYERAIATRPSDVDARRERVLLLEAMGARADAVREARALLLLDASDSVATAIVAGQPNVVLAPDSAGRRLTERWYDAGWSLTRTGRHVEAIQAYRESVSADASNVSALNNLGWSLGLLGLFDLAMPVLERAVHVAPDNALARSNLAWVRMMSTTGARVVAP